MAYDTKKAAGAEYAKVTNEINEHRFMARDGISVNGYLDRWEPAHGRDLEESSRGQFRHALRRVREFLGDRKLQSVTR